MDLDLQTILNSGNITNMFIGGITADERVVIVSDLDAYVKANGTTLQELIKLNPQLTPPIHFESNTYYSLPDHTITVQTDIADVNLNLGLEMFVRVINQTGATILNGKACTPDGVDPTSELPRAKLAKADSFDTAFVLGIATSDIPDGEEGFLTNFGKVKDFDTSALTVGLPMYLSDTVAGDYSTTLPDILSRVGGCLVADAVNGIIQVNIDNSINLPNVFGILQGQTLGNETYLVTGAPQPIDNYQTEISVVTATNLLTGEITIPKDGTYDGTFTMQMSFPSSTSTRTVFFDIYDGVGNKYSYPYNIARDATTSASSFTIPFEATEGQDITMNISADTSITVTIDTISFSVKSLDIR